MHTVALRGLGVINSNNEKEDRKSGRGQAKGTIWRKIIVGWYDRNTLQKWTKFPKNKYHYLKG